MTHPIPTSSDTAGFDTRPLALLDRLARARLPVMVVEDGEIELVRVLQLSGSLRARVPDPVRTLDGHGQAPATVVEITGLGHQLLASFVRRHGARRAHPLRSMSSRIRCAGTTPVMPAMR